MLEASYLWPCAAMQGFCLMTNIKTFFNCKQARRQFNMTLSNIPSSHSAQTYIIWYLIFCIDYIDSVMYACLIDIQNLRLHTFWNSVAVRSCTQNPTVIVYLFLTKKLFQFVFCQLLWSIIQSRELIYSCSESKRSTSHECK